MIHKFNDEDKRQRWFKLLHESLQLRLSNLREINDRPMSIEDTATLRGQIKEIKALIRDMNLKEEAQR